MNTRYSRSAWRRHRAGAVTWKRRTLAVKETP